MKPALAQVSTLNAPFESDVEDYAAAKCPDLEIWLGKLETYLESHALDDVRRLLDQHGILAPVASFQGGLLATQGDARREAWDHFARRLAACCDLGIATLVLAADLHSPLSHQDLDRVRTSLRQAADEAARHGVRLALEFQASAVFCNNLQTAAALVDEVGSESLGLCLDVFHFQTGPSKAEDLELLTADNLAHVQVADVAGVPRELAGDADRVLPGDGDYRFEPLLNRLRAIDYQGYVAVELMNPRIWQVPPLSFAEIAMTALRKLLGQADMGG